MKGLTDIERDVLERVKPLGAPRGDFQQCSPVEHRVVARLVARGLVVGLNVEYGLLARRTDVGRIALIEGLALAELRRRMRDRGEDP
jgi:hypothetical protein